MPTEYQIKKYNEFLNSLTEQEIQDENKKQYEENRKDFLKLKDSLSKNWCNYCNNPISYFSKDKPCLHWLLKPKGFKKKHFILLFKDMDFHRLETYLRWVANCDKPFQNINDLVEEKAPSKFIEETIRYKNLEWSFSCSYGDRIGHKHKHEGKMPHYHFQMKFNDYVIINYNSFHIPFTEYDEFYFAVKENKFEKLKSNQVQGAGMQDIFSKLTPEDLINNIKYTEDEENAQLNVNILIEADEGTTISGDDIANLIKERSETKVSMAKLVQKLKNVKIQTIILPGLGVPKISDRKKNRNRK